MTDEEIIAAAKQIYYRDNPGNPGSWEDQSDSDIRIATMVRALFEGLRIDPVTLKVEWQP